MKSILFTLFVIAALWLYYLLVKDQNFEHFHIDPTGKYYNPI